MKADPVSDRAESVRSAAYRPFEDLYIWCGVTGLALAFAGLFVGHLFPPPGPQMPAAQLVAFYSAHKAGILWGTILICFGTAMLGPWLGALTQRMTKMGDSGRAAAYVQLGLGMLLILEIIIPTVFLQGVLFRIDGYRGEALTLALNDIFSVLFISPAYTLIVELLVSGIAILRDRTRVFPRWVGVANILGVIPSAPAIATIFVKSGPFSWSGLFGWWVPFLGVGLWFVPLTVAMLRPEPATFERQPVS
jgi:hypothetical protein